MKCSNCGNEIAEGVKFCNHCGQAITPIETVPSTQEGTVAPQPTVTTPPTPPVQAPAKKSNAGKILLIIGGVIFLFIVGIIVTIVVVLKNIYNSQDKLVCESDSGDITILHNGKSVVGYSAKNGYEFDWSAEQKKAQEKDYMDEYLDEFATRFMEETGGTCHKEAAKK